MRFLATSLMALSLAACGLSVDLPDLAPSPAVVAHQQPLPTAQERCEALRTTRLQGDQVQLVAVFESSAAEISNWHESGRVPGGGRGGAGLSPFRSRPPAESIASCYFDGTFTYRGTLPPGATAPVFERMLFLLDSTGYIHHELGGTKNLLPIVRPA